MEQIDGILEKANRVPASEKAFYNKNYLLKFDCLATDL